MTLTKPQLTLTLGLTSILGCNQANACKNEERGPKLSRLYCQEAQNKLEWTLRAGTHSSSLIAPTSAPHASNTSMFEFHTPLAAQPSSPTPSPNKNKRRTSNLCNSKITPRKLYAVHVMTDHCLTSVRKDLLVVAELEMKLIPRAGNNNLAPTVSA